MFIVFMSKLLFNTVEEIKMYICRLTLNNIEYNKYMSHVHYFFI